MMSTEPTNLRSVLTTPSLLERAADKHGVPVVIVDDHFCCVIYRPNAEAILWSAVVPAGERAA